MGDLTNTTWRAVVASRVLQLEGDLSRADAQSSADPTKPDTAVRDILASRLTLAQRTAEDSPRVLSSTWLRRWGSGGDQDTAWRALHEAEQLLWVLLPSEIVRARLPELRASLTLKMADDGRLTQYVGDLDAAAAPPRRTDATPIDDKATVATNPLGAPPVAGPATAPKPAHPSRQKALSAAEREQLVVIRAAIDAVTEEANNNARNYRNWLLIVSGATMTVLLAIAVGHLISPGFIALYSAGEGNTRSSVLQVELAGALGGALMALVTLSRLQIFSGAVALPLWQALIRIPAGATAGLVGALLIQSKVMPSVATPDFLGLLGFATLLGAAPEIVLRFFDRKVNEATDAARTKSDPLTKVPQQSVATGQLLRPT